MTNNKISLVLTLPGRVMMSEQEYSKNPKDNYNVSLIKIKRKKGGKLNVETIKVNTRKTKIVQQHINVCESAYKYWLATPPTLKDRNSWKKLSNNEKIRKHVEAIAHDFRATKFDYYVS